MSQYLNSIEDIINNIISTIDKYSSYDNNAVLSTKAIQEIKEEINKYKKTSIRLTNNLSKTINFLNKEIKNTKKKYIKLSNEKEKELKELEESEKINISKSEIEKNQKIELLNEKLESDKRESIKKIQDNTINSKENLKYFINDYKETEKRLSFKNQSSKDYYNSSIIKYNDELDNILKNLDKAYSRIYINYDSETKALMNKYSRLIEEYNNQYKKIQKEREDYSKTFDKENKEFTINLNNEIRPLYDIKNRNIEQRRVIYSSEQNSSNIEKENKRHDLHNETNKITKDFIVNVKEIDSKIEEYKKEYNENRDNKINKTLYLILEEHKRLQFEVSELISKDNSLDTKKLIILKYKLFASKKEKLEAKLDNDLRTLEGNYLKTIENENFEKKQLELEKNSNIKKYIEEENTIIKQNQEYINKFEFNLKYDESKYKLTYDINSSILKHNFNIEQIKKKREKNIILAEYDIELQRISYKIKIAEANLEMTKSLNILVHEYEDKIYQKKKNFHTVYTMLEIERHKTLREYNENLYRLKLNEAKEELRFNTNLSNLKNKNYEIDINNELEINKKLSNIEILSFNNEHNKNKLNSEVLIINTKNEISSYLEEYKIVLLNELFNINFKIIQFETSNFYSLIKSMCVSIFKIIHIVDNSIGTKNEIIIDLRNFFIALKVNFINYLENITKCYKDNIKALIDENKKTLNNLYYDQIKEKYKSQYNNNLFNFKNKIQSTKEEIEKILDENTSYNKRLYALKYQYSNEKSYYKKIEIQNKTNKINKNTNKNNRKIKYYKSSIQKIQKEIEKSKNYYNKSIIKIQKSLNKELKSYYILFDDISEINIALLAKINNIINEENNSNNNIDYFIDLESKITKIMKTLNTTINSIYTSINDFKLKRFLELEKKNVILKNQKKNEEFTTASLIKEMKLEYTKNYKKSLKEYNDEINICKKNIQISNINSQKELSNLRDNYEKITKTLQDENINLGNYLYTTLYAVIENIKDLELDYHISIGDNNLNKYKSYKDELKDNEISLINRINELKRNEEKKLVIYEENIKANIKAYYASEAQSIIQENQEFHNLREKYKKDNTENYFLYRDNIAEADYAISFNKKNLNKNHKILDNELKLRIKEEYKKHKIQLKKIDKTIKRKKYFTN